MENRKDEIKQQATFLPILISNINPMVRAFSRSDPWVRIVGVIRQSES